MYCRKLTKHQAFQLVTLFDIITIRFKIHSTRSINNKMRYTKQVSYCRSSKHLNYWHWQCKWFGLQHKVKSVFDWFSRCTGSRSVCSRVCVVCVFETNEIPQADLNKKHCKIKQITSKGNYLTRANVRLLVSC